MTAETGQMKHWTAVSDTVLCISIISKIDQCLSDTAVLISVIVQVSGIEMFEKFLCNVWIAW